MMYGPKTTKSKKLSLNCIVIDPITAWYFGNLFPYAIICSSEISIPVTFAFGYILSK